MSLRRRPAAEATKGVKIGKMSSRREGREFIGASDSRRGTARTRHRNRRKAKTSLLNCWNRLFSRPRAKASTHTSTTELKTFSVYFISYGSRYRAGARALWKKIESRICPFPCAHNIWQHQLRRKGFGKIDRHRNSFETRSVMIVFLDGHPYKSYVRIMSTAMTFQKFFYFTNLEIIKRVVRNYSDNRNTEKDSYSGWKRYK